MPAKQPTGIDQATTRLIEAAQTLVPCPPVRHLLPDQSASTAYAVQSALTRHRLASGRRFVGRKRNARRHGQAGGRTPTAR